MGQKRNLQSKKTPEKCMQRTFFTEVTGNKVSDHYLRNINKGLSKNSCSVDLSDIKNIY